MHGFTNFLDFLGRDVGQIRWSHPDIVPPGAKFTYGESAGLVADEIIDATTSYRTEVSWASVPCP